MHARPELLASQLPADQNSHLTLVAVFPQVYSISLEQPTIKTSANGISHDTNTRLCMVKHPLALQEWPDVRHDVSTSSNATQPSHVLPDLVSEEHGSISMCHVERPYSPTYEGHDLDVSLGLLTHEHDPSAKYVRG